jgi:hypothetical protein
VDSIVVVHVASKLEVGDKLATAHGLKSMVEEVPYGVTVRSIILQDEMPDERTGKPFKQNLLLSTKNSNMFVTAAIFRIWPPNLVMRRQSMAFSFEDRKSVKPRLPRTRGWDGAQHHEQGWVHEGQTMYPW